MMKDKELAVSMKCVKYMIFVANFMFVLVGFLLISIGTTIKTIYSDFDVFLVGHFSNASNLAIAVGIMICIVSLFGCIGAIKGSVCLVNTYALMLFLVLILEVAVSIAAYAMRSNITWKVRKQMYESMDYYKDPSTAYLWNATQYNLQCCGVEGPYDWMYYRSQYNFEYIFQNPDVYAENGTDSMIEYAVPDTCCRDEKCMDTRSVYKRGCLNQISRIVSECALLLGIGAMCIAFIQVLGVIFAHLLARSIRRLKTQIQVEKMENRQHVYEQITRGSVNNEKVSPVLYSPTNSQA
ncbi:hypothetical protein JTB14_000944 [Gonioctena quinquepunctata]|nr:hypothetical protein JTB14_000944 [Gonioctena quinquepunctata]